MAGGSGFGGSSGGGCFSSWCMITTATMTTTEYTTCATDVLIPKIDCEGHCELLTVAVVDDGNGGIV